MALGTYVRVYSGTPTIASARAGMASRTIYLGIIGGHNGGHELAKLIDRTRLQSCRDEVTFITCICIFF